MRWVIKCAAHITLYFVIIGSWKSSTQFHPSSMTNPVWLTTIKSLELHIPHYRARKSLDVRVHSTVLEICDQFWTAMVAPKYYQTKIVNRTCLVCTLEQKGCRKRKGNQKNTKCWCKMVQAYVGWFSPQELKAIYTKQLEPSTSSFHVPFTTESHASRGFPSPNPPPRPRPELLCASTAALASRSRSATASRPSRAAQCSGVLPREPRTRGGSRRAEPKRNEGEKKFWKKFGHLKSRKFWKLLPLKILPRFKLTLYVWDVLRTSSWLKKLLPLVFYRSRVSHVCNQDVLG